MALRPNEPGSTGQGSPSRRAVLAALGASLPLAAATPAVAAAGDTGPVSAADAVVSPSSERQIIKGFGGMNHTVWISDLTPEQRNTAFGNGEGQLGFSVLRIPVHEDRANWSREVATARRAIEHGATVIASPWNPPPHMTETFVRGGQTDARRLRHDMYGSYAQHLNDFHQFMRGNGVELYAISVQNEPDYAHDWTWWTAGELVRFLRENAGSIGTRIIAPESFQYVKSISDPILNDPQALSNLDILGAHLYGTQFQNFPYPLFKQRGAGKELWMTEVYHPNSSDSADLWPQALDVGEHMHRALVDAEFQAYVWWYIRRGYGPMRENGTISKRGASMAHFSKWIRPGHRRIEATSQPAPNVYVSAYKAPDSRITVVAVNKGGAPVSQRFVLENTTRSSVLSWVTDAGRTLAAQGGTGLSNGSFTATLPATSITTYVTQ
ncbi:glycoside hydrolase family 30 beta sandwich domain-containing protein [Streptomyces xiamenensis]|uniref:glycoside hydrolase family 30 beta sandwich domain-containing protein n=1 Tax=Streptomyces xiamenensis TaxID=408015 RepID=UPI0036F0EA51